MISKLGRRRNKPSISQVSLKALKLLAAPLAVIALMATIVSAGPAKNDPLTEKSLSAQETTQNPYSTMTATELEQIMPVWPNPYLSFLPSGAAPDYAYWREVMKRGAAQRALRQDAVPRSFATRLITHDENETQGSAGVNDTPGTAEFIANLGTAPEDDSALQISGDIAPLPAASTIAPAPVEDDGDITKATPTGLTATDPQAAVKTVSGQIGDGPFAATSGDYDCYATAAQAGESIILDFNRASGLAFVIDLYRSSGDRLGTLNPQSSTAFRDLLTAPFSDTYTFCVRALMSGLLLDPFDSSSGRGASDTGAYQITLSAPESDVYGFDLAAGDVVGASLTGDDQSSALMAPDGSLSIASSQDVSNIHPDTSPLPNGGDAVFAYVAPSAGRYMLKVTGAAGAYQVQLRLFRPALESSSATELRAQRLFLDFDGATLNTTELFGAASGFESATLSPLSNFLSAWGLSPADLDAVIDAIITVVTENLSQDPRARGNNGDRDASTNAGEFDIEILNSRDHIDPFGEPNVSRVIMGGTRNESGIATLGMAEHIDPGNFVRSATALVLLDLLSAASFDPNSLNQFALAPSATMIDLVGRGLGNLASHEAGHLFGNFHTDNANTRVDIMDLGGNLANMVGVGADGIFGSTDDADVDLGEDSYMPSEGFLGTEDTLNTVAFDLSTGPNNAPTISPIPDQQVNQNESTGPIGFTVGDADDFDTPGSLSLSASTNDSELVPLSNIEFYSDTALSNDTAHTIAVTPVAGRSGTAEITVIVSDGQDQITERFRLSVSTVSRSGDSSLASSGGGGGCTLNTGADAGPLLPAMLLIAFLYILRRKYF
jgi:hypothetical protein